MGRVIKCNPCKLPPLTKEQLKQLKEAAKKPIILDEDCPELTSEQMKKAKRVFSQKN